MQFNPGGNIISCNDEPELDLLNAVLGRFLDITLGNFNQCLSDLKKTYSTFGLVISS